MSSKKHSFLCGLQQTKHALFLLSEIRREARHMLMYISHGLLTDSRCIHSIARPEHANLFQR